ncbi:hypothetical protein M758_1G310800 [Ceratodon purpureus]|uniref:Uncharacterized protein n=1 Tax=Ceratodon purpureus TaxID=3225 RepID=A0A8T0JEG0_CERPU|nr:hypothetical protein KC19_1G318000 [Ceratodon purpureus]KAG0593280.1 hypothetical protein KC19_1G318000 [Ceratodon purpureus]KAG0632196.1 hypothetical protein M758_1G310800 [Ceratodon purpureus]
MVNMLNLALPSHATKHEGPLVFMKSKPLIVPNYSFFDKHPQVRIRLDDPIRDVQNLTQLLPWCVYADAIMKVKTYRTN